MSKKAEELIQELKDNYGCGMDIPLNYEEVEMVVDALEKQIPKEKYIYFNRTEHCPNCDHDITQISYDDVYCSRCGQKLKKSETAYIE